MGVIFAPPHRWLNATAHHTTSEANHCSDCGDVEETTEQLVVSFVPIGFLRYAHWSRRFGASSILFGAAAVWPLAALLGTSAMTRGDRSWDLERCAGPLIDLFESVLSAQHECKFDIRDAFDERWSEASAWKDDGECRVCASRDGLASRAACGLLLAPLWSRRWRRSSSFDCAGPNKAAVHF
jgi:hypothetical protein